MNETMDPQKQAELSASKRDAELLMEHDALLMALDNSSIHYYRFLIKEKMLVLPNATAEAWMCEKVYHNVPEDDAFFSYLAEEDKPSFLEMIYRIMDGEPTASSQFRLDDFGRWCRVNMTTVRWDEEGKPVEAIAIIEDISKEVAREELSKARNETLSFLTQVFQIGALVNDATVVVYDFDTNTTTAPAATAELWGVPTEHQNAPEDTVERGLIHEDSQDVFLELHEKMRNGAEEASARIILREPDGQVGTYELVFRALTKEDGTPSGKAVGIYRNISELEEKSFHQEAMSRALSRGINAAFFADLDTNTFELEHVISEYMINTIGAFVNENAKSGNINEVGDLYCDQLVCDEDRERIRYELKAETMSKKIKETPSYYVQFRIKENEENQEHFEMHIVATDIPGNNAFISFRCIDDQISRELQQQQALKEAYFAAKQASNAKSEFFSRMSHDIRTPMNAIMGMTALANTHIDDKERVLDCLSKITLSSQHLLALINDVLDMSKIESGMVDLNIEGFDLAKLVENFITMSQYLINAYEHELLVNVHDIEHEKVIGDPQRIQQALMNLMSNAAKYTPPGGTIRLSITEKPMPKKHTGCYEFVFEDTGIGMDREFVEKIFEPFTRAEDERVNNQQGTGLGMAITYNIVQMMNGDISVESEPGKGSRFTVTIYLEIQEEDEELSIEQLRGLPVLVVDDDQATCESASNMLCDLGMEGEWVTSGQGAVERVLEHHKAGNDYFVVFMDWKMPGMDGVATTKAIRKAIGDAIPIIIASAYDWSDIEASARKAGVNAFISKPLFRSRVLHQLMLILNDDVEVPEKAQPVGMKIASSYPGKRILLVEDNLLNREIAVEFFKMADLEIDIAENGQQAVDMMEASEDGYYDMVFMDIQMPIMNGYDASRAIRSSKRQYLKTVPIIAMTADAFAEDVNSARSAGMNDHLAKPIDFDKLNPILDAWLSN